MCIRDRLDPDGLITARAKQISIRPLDKIRVQEERTPWQVFNLLLPIGLIGLFGAVRYGLRRRKFGRQAWRVGYFSYFCPLRAKTRLLADTPAQPFTFIQKSYCILWSLLYLLPVSYTHLDVYKRQPYVMSSPISGKSIRKTMTCTWIFPCRSSKFKTFANSSKRIGRWLRMGKYLIQ